MSMSKSNENQAQDIVLALGATAEICGELKRQLLKNGFTTTEALYLVEAFMIDVMSPKNKEDK